jgi:hypothetical protein
MEGWSGNGLTEMRRGIIRTVAPVVTTVHLRSGHCATVAALLPVSFSQTNAVCTDHTRPSVRLVSYQRLSFASVSAIL